MGKRDAHSENKHHNIPGSRGGSGKEINLSIIPEKRHDQFHVWSWNRTPEMLIRKMALHAIGLEGTHALPPAALEDFFMEMRVPDWTDLYDPDAVIWLCGKQSQAEEQIAKAHDYTIEHITEELKDTRGTVNALLHGRYFPIATEDEWKDFLQQALAFFQTSSPREAVQQLLTETYKDRLLWVKPLKDALRQRLLAILASAKPVSIHSHDEDSFVDVLEDHEMYLLSSFIHERSR